MDAALLSFAEQALRYFDRPHETVAREPILGPSAWRTEDLRRDRRWEVDLDAAAIAELEGARDAVRGRGLDLATMRREDFVLPTLGPAIRTWTRALVDGPGVLLLHGLPVEVWGDEDTALIYWGVGLHLGRPGAQNAVGERLGHVVDTGEDAANPFVRRYRTAGDIAFHCDLADVVGLLCLRQAPRGGASRIVSSVAVYNALLARRPDLVERLYEPVALDRRDETTTGSGWIPVVPCRHAGGRLRTFYHSDYFRSAARHADAPVGERELFDVYEAIAADPGLYFDMALRPGDVQLVSNHVVLHARTAYEDGPTSVQKRHLLRLWLTLEEAGSCAAT